MVTWWRSQLDQSPVVRWLRGWRDAYKASKHLQGLLGDPVREAVLYSVVKTAKDTSFHPTKDHDKKRAEAEEWARHYARHNGIKIPSAWLLRFLIEYEVGHRKGRI